MSSLPSPSSRITTLAPTTRAGSFAWNEGSMSPLASGFLFGKHKVNRTYTCDDVRRVITRFSKENVLANQPLLDLITCFANQRGATHAQISLAWMLHKKDLIVPIPGARKPERIQENLSAADVELIDNDLIRSKRSLEKSKFTEMEQTRILQN